MTTDSTPRYTIDELAQLAGVTRRTVRYYISRGLLPPPEGLGRGPHYTQEHRLRLETIRNRQLAGESLDRIAAALDGAKENQPEKKDASEPPQAPSMEMWVRVPIFDGVELHLRGIQFSPETANYLQAFLQPLLADWMRRVFGLNGFDAGAQNLQDFFDNKTVDK